MFASHYYYIRQALDFTLASKQLPLSPLSAQSTPVHILPSVSTLSIKTLPTMLKIPLPII